MPPDNPQNRHALPRSRVVEVIEQSQEDAFRQLRAAGIPETQALAVMQQIATFCLETLKELDRVYREFEELVAHHPGRSHAQQTWLNDKAAGLLTAVEAAIAALVAEAINQAKEDYRTGRSQPREVITTVPAPARRPAWEESLWDLGRELRPVLWAVGFGVWFLVWFGVSASITWAVIAVGISVAVVFLFEKAGLIFILIAGGVCVLLLV
jgi:hypothetical protein